ncbi:MAG TPA: hypothetical protein VFT45_17225 [Longimicrobium sp.]|nr:hypothetical protein [Longimicrobium sp.]
MRSIVTLVVLAFAACLAPAPAAAQMAGSYMLAEVNGHALPAPSPEEADVVVLTMSLVLTPEGRFMMEATANLDEESGESRQTAEGAWTVDADSLILTSDDEEEDGVLRFRWRMEGGMLKLYTENGHEFAFRRT